jgi:hypothetical protein
MFSDVSGWNFFLFFFLFPSWWNNLNGDFSEDPEDASHSSQGKSSNRLWPINPEGPLKENLILFLQMCFWLKEAKKRFYFVEGLITWTASDTWLWGIEGSFLLLLHIQGKRSGNDEDDGFALKVSLWSLWES